MVKRAVQIFILVTFACWSALAATYTVPAGTIFNCRLAQTLSTSVNFEGQPFAATLTEPVVLNGNRILPPGATVRGRIASLSRPGHIKGVGKILLVPETIALPNGRTFHIDAVLLHAYGAPGAKVANPEGVVKGPTARMRDLKEIGIGTGGGGVLGAIFGGLHGTLIGGVIGGAAGLLYSFHQRGPDLTLPRGTELKFELSRELVVGRSGVTEYNLNSQYEQPSRGRLPLAPQSKGLER